ncbi:hypothetical protein EPI10_032197 [Gossypium australe]|uniref:Uncharacterized protein n=1 Tax=Gossypium australe TaxID=47621 RepID=A0A5B6X3Z9_9ROSI|nr:hypothetical protein EPI10_032197 [Gossypium australe]
MWGRATSLTFGRIVRCQGLCLEELKPLDRLMMQSSFSVFLYHLFLKRIVSFGAVNIRISFITPTANSLIIRA